MPLHVLALVVSEILSVSNAVKSLSICYLHIHGHDPQKVLARISTSRCVSVSRVRHEEALLGSWLSANPGSAESSAFPLHP